MPVIARDQSVEECDALLDAAAAVRRSKDLDGEVDALTACIEHPCARHELDLPELWEQLAQARYRQGRLDEAIEAWEEAIAAGYRSAPHPRANIAELLVEAGRRDEGDALYARLRAECGGDVWLYNSAGFVYARVGDHDEALRWIDAGIEVALDTGDPEQIFDQLTDMRESSLHVLGRDSNDELAQRIAGFEPPPPRYQSGESYGEAEISDEPCGHCGWNPDEERASRVSLCGVEAIARVLDRPRLRQQPVRSDKVGRNAPCPCGSGRKSKRCCGR